MQKQNQWKDTKRESNPVIYRNGTYGTCTDGHLRNCYEAQKEVKDKNAVVLSSYAIATNQIADQAKWHDNMIFGKRNGLIYMQEKLLAIELSLVALMNRPTIWRKGFQ